jgi:hypothetical protein
MHTFAPKQNQPQQGPSRNLARTGAVAYAENKAHPILRLQRTIGIQAVQQLLPANAEELEAGSATRASTCLAYDFSQVPLYPKARTKIQPKLTVNTPGDIYEQEADRIADAVMAGYSPPVDRVLQDVQPKLYRVVVRPEDAVDSVFPPETESGAESPEASPTEEVQRSASEEAGAVSPHFEQSLQQATHGGGEALPSPTRSFMESRFGWDFSSVRVHSDARAHALAREVNACAFTLGNNIFFARSQYQPDRLEGQRLLAHELTHVVQQSAERVSRQVQRLASCSSYPGYNASVNLRTYNCAGLATRTYRFIAPASATYDSIMANFVDPQSPSGNQCEAGRVKFWLWEYDMHSEDDRGTRLSRDHRDFHVVAGRTDPTGADPSDVYSKNGRRQVHGPGTGPSFRPAARERYLSNDPSETPATLRDGRPLFVVRSNMSEAISCAGCHP